MRVLIGDRFGRVLGEIAPSVDTISWILNEIGSTRICLPRSDSKATETYLRLGNRILIQADNGLPAWGGLLSLPRNWSKGRICTQCFTVENVFKTRVTGKNVSFYQYHVGEIFKILMRSEEGKDSIGIELGNTWMGGSFHYPRYHYSTIWDILSNDLRQMERCDFKFTPYLDSGFIKFKAELFYEAGQDRSNQVALVEGRNVAAGLEFTEQGELINKFYAIGEGSTWGADRLVRTGRVQESITKYGLREASDIFPGTSYEYTLEMQARNALKMKSEPRQIFVLPVSNNEPGTYSSYRLGDRVKCELYSFGFQGFNDTVRVLGRDYSPATGNCRLAVEVPRYPEYWIYEEEVGNEA